MTSSKELAEFLVSRRAKVTPEQAGLRSYGQRRVPGLRREEVASLAGVSFEYYRRLERGISQGVSDSVLNALASALQLDGVERAHLFDLARTMTNTTSRTSRPARQRVRPQIQLVVDRLSVPAVVSNGRGDYLASNRLGRALYEPAFDSREQPANSARFTFLDPASQDFFVDWEAVAKDLVASLRSEAGRNPYDRALSDLVGELSTRSQEFGVWWAAHNVRRHQTGQKRLHHPLVGRLDVNYEVMEPSADEGLRIAIYTAEVGSESEAALNLLDSWTGNSDDNGHQATQPSRPADHAPQHDVGD